MPLYLKERLKKSFLSYASLCLTWYDSADLYRTDDKPENILNKNLLQHQSEHEALIKFMEDLEKIVPNDCAKKGDIFMKLLFSEGDSKRYWTLTI